MSLQNNEFTDKTIKEIENKERQKNIIDTKSKEENNKEENDVIINLSENKIMFQNSPKTSSKIIVIEGKPFHYETKSIRNKIEEINKMDYKKLFDSNKQLAKKIINEMKTLREKNKSYEKIKKDDENIKIYKNKKYNEFENKNLNDNLKNNSVEEDNYNRINFFNYEGIQNIDFNHRICRRNVDIIKKKVENKPKKKKIMIHDFQSSVDVVYKDPFEEKKKKNSIFTKIFYSIFGGWLIDDKR